MVKVISQETFDAVVKENVEEFGLENDEAVKEAIAQFESQVFSVFFFKLQLLKKISILGSQSRQHHNRCKR